MHPQPKLTHEVGLVVLHRVVVGHQLQWAKVYVQHFHGLLGVGRDLLAYGQFIGSGKALPHNIERMLTGGN